MVLWLPERRSEVGAAREEDQEERRKAGPTTYLSVFIPTLTSVGML